jgi:hypothetical protein
MRYLTRSYVEWLGLREHWVSAYRTEPHHRESIVFAPDSLPTRGSYRASRAVRWKGNVYLQEPDGLSYALHTP